MNPDYHAAGLLASDDNHRQDSRTKHPSQTDNPPKKFAKSGLEKMF